MSAIRCCFVLLLALGLGDSVRGAGPCCDGCGCQVCTKKVCRLVCETKKVTEPVYSIECEDYCLPGRSIKLCEVRECPEDCQAPGCCHRPKRTIWQPTCGKVCTRRKLVKSEKTKEVPSYKCVVEDVCVRCGHCANSTTLEGAAVPPEYRSPTERRAVGPARNLAQTTPPPAALPTVNVAAEIAPPSARPAAAMLTAPLAAPTAPAKKPFSLLGLVWK